MFDPEVAAALEDLTRRLSEQFPEIEEALEGLTDEESAQDTLIRLTHLTADKPEMAAEINTIAMEVFAPLRDDNIEPDPRDPEEVKENLPAFQPESNPLGLTAEDMIFQPPKSRLPALDPMVEAAIIERVQFDGDIPELRSGDLPEGGRPAVPVNTQARNPVAIGQMLNRASEETHEEIKSLSFEHTQKLAELGVTVEEDGSLNLPAHLDPTDIQLLPDDPEGYKRGQLPVPKTVESPTGSALAKLTPEDRALSAWSALATTQGRRSAVSVIQELVETTLRSAGMEVRSNARPDLGRKDVPVYVEWTQKLSGPNSTQGNFSFIDIASKVLAKKILDQAGGLSIDDPVLEVIPLNTVDVRRVGWAARLVEGGA